MDLTVKASGVSGGLLVVAWAMTLAWEGNGLDVIIGTWNNIWTEMVTNPVDLLFLC